MPDPPTRAAGGPRPVENVVPGVEIATPEGRFYLVERRMPGTARRGGVIVSSALGCSSEAISLIGRDPDLAGFDPARAAFIDTETTGLAGGTGTYAFMVGIGFFRDGDLVVRQYFMRDLDEERPMMLAIAEELRRFEWSVSFNGKSFDIPLLRTRFVMSRLRPSVDHMVHLDLLHASRRLWRHASFAAGGLSLGALEGGLLEHVRPFDVPSWRIPEMYFDYLRSRDASPLESVFAHNHEDIASLVCLLAVMNGVVSDWRRPGAIGS